MTSRADVMVISVPLLGLLQCFVRGRVVRTWQHLLRPRQVGSSTASKHHPCRWRSQCSAGVYLHASNARCGSSRSSVAFSIKRVHVLTADSAFPFACAKWGELVMCLKLYCCANCRNSANLNGILSLTSSPVYGIRIRRQSQLHEY